MKLLLPFILILTIILSCEKEKSLSITGTWSFMTNVIAPDTSFSQDGRLIVIQNNDNTLTGTFELLDNLGYYGKTSLLPSSIITGNSLTMEVDANNSTFVFTYLGTVNDSYTSMTGILKVGYQVMGNWTATKK